MPVAVPAVAVAVPATQSIVATIAGPFRLVVLDVLVVLVVDVDVDEVDATVVGAARHRRRGRDSAELVDALAGRLARLEQVAPRWRVRVLRLPA
jgi:hypothetical protein